MTVGMINIRGMNSASSFAHSVTMVTSITWGIILFTLSLVPLHSLGAFHFLRSIMGELILSTKLCGGISGGSKELRNSVGHWIASLTPTIVSIELYNLASSDSCYWICSSMAFTVLFLGARMVHWQIHLWSLKWYRILGNTQAFSTSIDSAILQKLFGMMMSSLVGSNDTLPSSRVSSYRENGQQRHHLASEFPVWLWNPACACISRYMKFSSMF